MGFFIFKGLFWVSVDFIKGNFFIVWVMIIYFFYMFIMKSFVYFVFLFVFLRFKLRVSNFF